MNIYLVQHGTAVEKSINPDRPLSADGIDEGNRVAALVASAGIAPTRILHSGKLRSEETAALFSKHLPAAGPPEATKGIAPTDPVEDFARRIGAWNHDVLVCGHQPFMGRLVAYLLGLDPSTPTVEYVPGSIAGLSRDDSGSWQLFWFIRPEVCSGG